MCAFVCVNFVRACVCVSTLCVSFMPPAAAIRATMMHTNNHITHSKDNSDLCQECSNGRNLFKYKTRKNWFVEMKIILNSI